MPALIASLFRSCLSCQRQFSVVRKDYIGARSKTPDYSNTKFCSFKCRQTWMSRPARRELHRKLSLKQGLRPPSRKGSKWTPSQRQKITKIRKGNATLHVAHRRILKEVRGLEKQGFKVMPITQVIPDMIAIKNGKIYAIEVEYNGKPNYDKYAKAPWFTNVTWLLRERAALNAGTDVIHIRNKRKT